MSDEATRDGRAADAAVGNAVTVYTTFPTEAAAASVGEALVAAGLAACANIVPGVTSIYVWEGKLEREREVVMLLKTRAALAERVTGEVRRLHPYINPAIVVLPIVGGSADYLAWVGAQTGSGDAAVSAPD